MNYIYELGGLRKEVREAVNPHHEYVLNQLEGLLCIGNNRTTRRRFLKLFDRLVQGKMRPSVERHPRLVEFCTRYNQADGVPK